MVVMSVELKMEEVERESLKDLKVIVEKSKEWEIEMVVIGGYAVRAFTNAYRHTKDIDMAISKEEQGSFTALLKSLGYELRNTEFGLAATKSFDSDFIDVHISVDKIYDISSGLSYPITNELFEEGKIRRVGTRYKVNKPYETNAPIVDLNTLMILKTMPKGRPEKDAIDIVSLILDQHQELDMDDIVGKCNDTNLTDHILLQLQGFAKRLNNGEVLKTWSTITGTTLSGVKQKAVRQFIKGLDNKMRGR
ncbi:Nucleotidyl transferase of unknown function protein [Marine Group I thaumarchaeote SCGC RSA3]|uniref:Nucleotidyl transferase AbiEii/AbiGii toxin family protein n=2 Tax=Marine Group I TaxID=905826 RepID=A0A081RQH6_9ARCH|nr:Nucleotidyl transferase of unknown function protein [Marine Group I thaumarchaeote SCGC AAA799-N04]KFM20429.1 Nucleotidyl transferase of unknown function protein [Marine Group I thaumarchaeote SCGC RSA3]